MRLCLILCNVSNRNNNIDVHVRDKTSELLFDRGTVVIISLHTCWGCCRVSHVVSIGVSLFFTEEVYCYFLLIPVSKFLVYFNRRISQ